MSHSQVPHAFDPYYTWLGIPPNERPISYYRLLGLKPFESNEAAIEAAVDQRLGFLRTKTLGPQAALAEKLMGEIAQARLVLLDPEKKKAYDAALTVALQDNSVWSQETTTSTGARAPWAAGPVPLESLPRVPTSQYRRKRGLSKEQRPVVIAIGVSLCCVLSILGLVAFQKWQAGRQNVAMPANAEHVAKGDRAAGAKNNAKQNPDVGLGHQPPPGPGPVANPRQRLPNQPLAAEPPAKPGVPPNENENGEAALMPLAAQPQLKAWLEKVKNATVIVEGRRGQGSGFFVTTAEGKPVVITNAHVVRGNPGIRIKLVDGRQIPIQQAAVLHEFDLAILAVEAINLPQPLELRDGLPEMGEKVFAYGAPRGLTGTLTEGIVSAVRSSSEIREVVDDDSFDKPVRKAESRWVQTTAPISPGNSGGPLLDEQGRVVGVNALGFNSLLAQNLNFALASTEVLHHLRAPRFAALPKDEPLFGNRPFPPPNMPGGESRTPTAGSSYPFEVYQCPDIKLPSGAVFQAGKVRPPDGWRSAIQSGHVLVCRQGQITVSAKIDAGGKFASVGYADFGGGPYPAGPGVKSPFAFYVEYDDGDLMKAALAFDKGLLHGPAVLFDEKGHPYVIANYFRGTRTGPLVVYDEEQYPALYVDFTRNRKHGLVCVFDEHLPRWIENWKANQLVEACLIRWENNQPQVLLQSALTNPDDLAASRELTAKVSRYLDGLDALEAELKRGVAEAFRWADNEIKKRRAAEFSVAATAAILARHREREAIGAAVRAEANARFKAGMGPPRP